MNLNLENFEHQLIHLVSLVLLMPEMLPKNGNATWNSNLGTVVANTNTLLSNFNIHF